jgi:aminoglycoside phosphotransferase (APT) family kinase protein
MIEPSDIAPKLRDAVARFLGPPGDIFDLRRLTAGATKATWSFTAQIGDSRQPLILQISTSASRPEDSGTSMMTSTTTSANNTTKNAAKLPMLAGKDDAAMILAAARAHVPVPPMRAVLTADCGLGEGCITDFVPGETIARRIMREPGFAVLRENFASQCGEILARIHAMGGDPAAVPFLVHLDGASQIALYRDVYDSFDFPVPALELAFRWALDNLPSSSRTTVTHGDFRMGNLICGEQHIHAVLDWELACVGEPMQDLGWLCVKTWRFGGARPVGGIGRREDLFAAYQRAAGTAVDPAAVHFWEVWGSVRWAVMCLIKGLAHRRDALHRTVEAIAIGRRMEEPLFDFLESLLENKEIAKSVL